MLVERDIKEYFEQRKIGGRGNRKTLVTVQSCHIRAVKGMRKRCEWNGKKRYDILPLDLLFFSSFPCPFFFTCFFSIDSSMDVMSQM